MELCLSDDNHFRFKPKNAMIEAARKLIFAFLQNFVAHLREKTPLWKDGSEVKNHPIIGYRPSWPRIPVYRMLAIGCQFLAADLLITTQIPDHKLDRSPRSEDYERLVH